MRFTNAAYRRLTLAAVLPLTLFVVAATAPKPTPKADAAPLMRTVGREIPIVLATDDRAHTLADIVGKKATVLVFMGTNCPISLQYRPELAAIQKEYAPKGVTLALVYSSTGISKQDILDASSAALKGLPHLLDSDGQLADQVGATLTPEVAVLDTTGRIRYRGRIDDRYAARGTRKGVGATSHDLRDALNAVLAGKPVKTPMVAAVGCTIERRAKAGERATITYAGTVAAILNKNCVTCHRSGEIGPMPLTSYTEAMKFASNIASVTQAKQMPPWKPVAGHGDFAGERRLTENEVTALQQWADAGAPEGDRSLTPPAPNFASGWSLGKPDLILRMPEAWHVKENDSDVYRCFVLPTGLTEDKDVVGVEYHAGNKQIVHHVIGYIDSAGVGRERDAQEEGAGYTSFGGPGFMPFGELGGWAPGNMAKFLPDGVGRRLPAGSDLVMQVHYHSDGKPEEDITEVGLYFAKKPVTKPFRLIPALVRKLAIPPGDANYTVTQTFPVPVDATIYQVTPHMHLLGKKIEMTATLPDNSVIPLIKIDDWNFNWQDTYVYKQPIHLPKGSKVTLTASYDNSTGNPRNPNSPPKEVTWGEATTDEMCIGFLGFTADNENDPMIKLYDRLLQRRGQRNGDGDAALQKAAQDLLGKKE